jgi:glutathione S-transferase
MSLKLYLHPLSSYCQKALIAFYENDTPFAPIIVDLASEASSAELKKLWPIGKFPVLRDEARDRTIPESSIIIEYLEQYYPGRTRLLPSDGDLAWQTRLRDRFFDQYVHEPMGKIVTDRLRPKGKNDARGVELAKAQLRTAYGMIEEAMRTRTWAMGEAFSMADCAAAPALFFAKRVLPFGDIH